MNLHATAIAWLHAHTPTILIEVTETKGSAPREQGTRMLVSPTRAEGTIGGGHLELLAIETARTLLSQPDNAPFHRHYPLGPALGQCCGGAVTLRYSRLTQQSLQTWPATQPRFFLQLYGAGHVGRAIVKLLAGIDCQVQWIDEREDEFPKENDLPAHIEKVCVEPVEAEVRIAPPGACYLVLTHNHDLDLRITEAILKRADFHYLGLIGSKTKRARFLHRYEARGIPADVLQRMTCPIGVPGIEGKEPEVIAVSVVAQLLQLTPQPATAAATSPAAPASSTR